MGTLEELKKDLGKNKERFVSDLVRFVKTRTDENPNYSLLIGAGCSITSGIRSATQLTEEWKKEIFLEEEGSNNRDGKDNLEEYFTKNHSRWYDSRNPYSSLFEKKYDLPRQRRMFVEQEVRDKIPSLGYSYLIKLVEKNYFKTLFTTNFDDLLNEAFYQFSDYRPILCAHDSAINSITVTSKRPKIIKLHGDYLFDDIKSTLRETESLEENIKNKFIEFAKDYGLIVIGYGGNDRSIVEVLTYLLKNEEYFKNGIYWCLRKDTIINDDLRKLLWKDRVYYVEIDGFDELMAEFNAKLNNSILPIDSSILNEKKNKLIQKLVSNTHLKTTSCKYIQKDLIKLENTLEKDVVNNFFEYLNKNDSAYEKENNNGFERTSKLDYELDPKQEKVLLNLKQELFFNNFQDALALINEQIENTHLNSSFYVQLLEQQAKCYRLLKEKEKAFNCYEKLIKLDPQELSYYLNAFETTEIETTKIEIIDKAISLYPFYYKLYYKKAQIAYKSYNNSLNKKDQLIGKKEIEDLINKSIELNPSKSNDAWELKLEFEEKFNDNEERIKKFEKTLQELEKQDKYYPSIIPYKIKLLKWKKTKKEEIFNYLEEEVIKSCFIPDYIKYNEFNLLDTYCEYNEKQLLEKRLVFIETNYNVDDEYWLKKSDILLKKFDRLKEAIETINNIKRKNRKVYNKLFNLHLMNQDIPKAEKIFHDHLSDDKDVKIDLYTAKEKYDDAIKMVEEMRSTHTNDYHLAVTQSFLLLKNKQYKEAYNFTRKQLEFSNYTDGYLLINYYLATKLHKGSVKPDKVKDKILGNIEREDIVKAAGFYLIDDEKQTYTYLNKVVNDNFERKYEVRNWVAFQDYFKKEKFKKLLDL